MVADVMKLYILLRSTGYPEEKF